MPACMWLNAELDSVGAAALTRSTSASLTQPPR
jgi:hypothetical protein